MLKTLRTMTTQATQAAGEPISAALPDERQLLYRVEQACALLACSRTSLYREIRRGRIHTLLIGGKRRITRQALLDYVAAHEQAQGAEQG